MPELFLSYSHEDKDIMTTLRKNLEKLGFEVWVDENGLTVGTSDWVQAIDDAIRRVDAMVVILTPNAGRSAWVKKEIIRAQRCKKPIFAAFVDGDELSAIPLNLEGAQYADMRSRANYESGFRKLVSDLAAEFGLKIEDSSIDLTDWPVRRKRGLFVWIGGAVGLAAVITVLALSGVIGGGGSTPVAENTPTVAPTDTIEPTGAPTETESPVDTPIPAPTSESEPTLTEDERARLLAESGEVRNNADWMPYTKIFDEVEMALVPVGCFMMGSGNMGDQLPIHKVCFTEPFWIDVLEVTNWQYGSMGCVDSSDKPYQPRNCVNWYQAKMHCENRGGRLPTEAEWEYVARGPDGLVYPWGNEFVSENVVYGANSYSLIWEGGSKPGDASWVGAHDLSGNLSEWVSDWYAPFYYKESPQDNPQGPETGSNRVIRGGSLLSDFGATELLSSYRSWYSPGLNDADVIGFRCVLDY